MIPELAHFALILALLFSVSTVFLAFVSDTQKQAQAFSWLVCGQVLFVLLSFALLIISFLLNDFSVRYVAQNSSITLPFIYKLGAAWGAHEGSMLLWVTILSLLMGWFLYQRATIDNRTRFIAELVLSVINVGFMLFILTTSNPFLRNFDALGHGADLNPLLQDIGFLLHPPILYTGYVGFGVVFAIAIAALVRDLPHEAWLKSMRRWALLAWSFLTLGITLGSWWAYRELGWGGFWFWDPVENASIMPWFSGTALLHALKLAEKERYFLRWALFLALITFMLSLLGTFLVRSGVLTSVHAFALSPARGVYMLIFLVAVCAASLSIFAYRFKPQQSKQNWAFYTKPSQLLLVSVLLIVMMATVLLGTLYPLALDALSLGQLSVGSPYFNTMAVLIMTPVLILMGVVPALYWYQQTARSLWSKLSPSLVAAPIIGFAMSFYMAAQFKLAAALGLSLGVWILVHTAVSLVKQIYVRRKVNTSMIAMTVAHSGLALLVIGVISSMQFGIEKELRVTPHEVVTIGDYALKLDTLSRYEGANFQSVKATLTLFKQQKKLTTIETEKRYYPATETALSHVGIDKSAYRDIYIALGEPLPGGAWSMRLYYKPLVRLIWFGGILMAIGALLPIFLRRYQRLTFLREWRFGV